MLLNVHVKNLALIDEAEIYFDEGLNILTGETGAGKSIIIGSINLALGAKLPKDIVREGAEYGLVELVFETGSQKVLNILEKMDIPCEDGQIIISRKISGGRSVIKVNGETISVASLKNITNLLIDICGQHDNQELMKKANHMGILDSYGHEALKGRLKSVGDAYGKYKALTDKLSEFDMDEGQREKELSFLEFQINEIEEASPAVGEDDELEEEYRRISHSQKIAEALNVVYGIIGPDEGSAAEGLAYGIRELSQVTEYDERLKGFYDTLADMDAMCSDLSREVSDYMEEMAFDGERTAYVTERLDLLNKLKFKYAKGNGGIEAVNKTLGEFKERYELLKNADESIRQLKEELKKASDKLSEESEKLSAARKKTALDFEKQLIKELKDLNFAEVRFQTEFQRLKHFTAKGNDSVEFYISTNAGEKLKPLSEVASGGELSRIMLGLKAMMAGQDDIDTLIFDEIDTGISGRTAGKVAEKMRLISGCHQVMAITHLPQIAAVADVNFLIEKSVKKGKTVTAINRLSEDGAVMELARMLGGLEVTEAVVENAKEMRRLAR